MTRKDRKALTRAIEAVRGRARCAPARSRTSWRASPGKMLASSRATAPSAAPYGCGLGNFPRVGLTTFRRR